MKVLVTGANGFIGSALCQEMSQQGHQVRGMVRRKLTKGAKVKGCTESVVGELESDSHWQKALIDIDVVVHLAALTHQSAVNSDWDIFQKVNVEGTRWLLLAAVKAKIKRFLFVSSIKVYGENAHHFERLSEGSTVGADCDFYGTSKLKTESLVREICGKNSIEFVIVRPPLVYGPGVKANFRSLLSLAKTGLPLPFIGLTNKRSMIAIDNLVDFMALCVTDERVGNKTYLISDGDDLSLVQLVTMIRRLMGMSPRLFYCPRLILSGLAFLLGRRLQLQKLTGSIQVDSHRATHDLNWQPVISVQEALNKTIKSFLAD